MNGKCFEMGAIQAFLDGEASPELSLRLTDHVAACDLCARVLAEAEEESSIVFSMLEREMNVLVPTQRLWTRINETIEVEKSTAPIWEKALAFVRASLANPSLVAAAGIVIVMGIFMVVVTVSDRTGTEVAINAPSQVKISEAPVTVPAPDRSLVTPASTDSAKAPSVEVSSLPAKKLAAIVTQANARESQRAITPQTADYSTSSGDAYLPGEESYVKTISDLRQNVDLQKDTVLTPSTRVSYERDMAVVNDSIKRMRDVVKKNPRNQAARQVLYSSYQDKIDLLNSVAQREELMATLR